MRVAIIAPPYPLAEAPAPPLGVTYVAAAFAAAGAEVRIFDYIVGRYSADKLSRQLADFSPQAVGATSVTLNFPGAAEILSTVKRLRPSATTLMGGPHVSFTAEQTLAAYPGIDLIVRGEGERTIAELMAARLEQDAWEGIRGLAFRKEGRVVTTEPQPLIEDLDSLPLPARHLLPLSRYQALGFPISLITSRGCPHGCIFCLGRKMVGNRVRQRSVPLVVDEIEEILSYGIDRINIADDLFVSQRGKVREVCDEILRRGVRFAWSAFARVDTVDRETLALMREAGCDSVSFGVETGDPEILKRIRKGITLEQVREAVALCRETGIIAHTSFIAGLPGETRETLERTAAFAAGLGSLYGYHHLAPFPGTTVRERASDFDIEILTDDWRLYDANRAIVRTQGLGAEEIDRFVDAFEARIRQAWDGMVRGWQDKTNPPEIDMQVEGHFRMNLVFRLLSEDLIEAAGVLPLTPHRTGAVEASLETLVECLLPILGGRDGLLARTLSQLAAKGYLVCRREGDRVRWSWTHNLKTGGLSLAAGSSLQAAPEIL